MSTIKVYSSFFPKFIMYDLIIRCEPVQTKKTPLSNLYTTRGTAFRV